MDPDSDPETPRVIDSIEFYEKADLYLEHHDQGLVPGTYSYQIRLRRLWDHKDPSDWEVKKEISVTIDHTSIQGTLLFDESVANAELVGSVTVPEGKTLTVSGTLSRKSGILYVYGTLNISGNLVIPPVKGENFGCTSPCLSVILLSEHHLTDVTGGLFEVGARSLYLDGQASGSSFTNFEDTKIVLADDVSVTLQKVINTPIDTSIDYDGVLEISDSSVRLNGCHSGQIFLTKSINKKWDYKPTFFGGSCSALANDTTFEHDVKIDEGEDVQFESVSSSFHGYVSISTGNTGKISFVDSLFSGGVGIVGSPTFKSCEFQNIGMLNGSNTVIEGSLIMGAFTLNTNRDLGGSPTIRNNAFMGQVAFRQTGTCDSAPEKPVAIGRNYYGDKAGLFKNKGKNHGFLGYFSGHAGALDQYWDDNWLTIAPHLENSPVSGARRNTRVLPQFWVNGVIVGQNTLNHDGSPGPLIKGRDTLVSVHLVASDNNLQGVRVYAKWNDQIIEAADGRNNLPLHRDHSLYSNNEIRYGFATYNFILPGVDDGSTDILSMPVKIFLDVSGVKGFDAEAYPAEDRELYSRELFFTTFGERPLRIAVQPIEVLGSFFGSYGTANPARLMQVLRTDLPDMLPISADKIELLQLPTSTYWTPPGPLQTTILLNRIAAGVEMELNWRGRLQKAMADFTVVVLPEGFTGHSFDGASMAIQRKMMFVAEHKPSAVLHEMGHSVGLYIIEEQYDLHPPSGLPVARATRFRTEASGQSRIDHLPGAGDFWYDLPDPDDFYYMDIMGNVDPVWTRPENLPFFFGWFRGTLQNPQASSPATAPAASPEGVDERRILITAAVDRTKDERGVLIPGTVWTFDVTGLDFPRKSVTGSGNHDLILYDAEGTQISQWLTLHPGYSVLLSGTIDFSGSEVVAYFCIEYREDETADPITIHCAYPAGLQSTTLLSPQPGDVIGPQFEAEWAVQADAGANQYPLLNAPHNNTAMNEAHLLHVLYYKTAPDGPWQFGLMTQGTGISVPSSFLPDTDYLALRLLSSDGLTRVEHVVEDLTVAPRPPQVTIFSPQNGNQSTANVLWELSADAEDFSGEGLQPGRWHSSIQGDLGEGSLTWETLITGTHELSYEVADKNGLSGSATVTVTVHDEMTSLDLGLTEPDLTLINASQDPAGYTPVELIPGEVNTFNLRVRNQGVDASARVRLFVQGPEDAQEALIGEREITLAPFEVGYLPFEFEPSATGIYSVRVLIDQVTPSDPDSSNNERTWTFRVFGELTAQFTGTPTSGHAPLTVHLTNQSTGDFDDCAWDFGDGNASNECDNPTHTYTAPGSYTVTLFVMHSASDAIETKTDYIQVADKQNGDFEKFYLPLIIR